MMQRVEGIDNTVDRMLIAGSSALVDAQKRSCVSHKHVDTGDMLNSIKATKIRRRDSDRYVDVYPAGKDRKGVRNAEKAFITNYGTRSQQGTRWVQSANEGCADEVHEIMRSEMENIRNAE